MVASKIIAGVTSLIEFDLLLGSGATVGEIREALTKPKGKSGSPSNKSSRDAAAAAGKILFIVVDYS